MLEVLIDIEILQTYQGYSKSMWLIGRDTNKLLIQQKKYN